MNNCPKKAYLYYENFLQKQNYKIKQRDKNNLPNIAYYHLLGMA